MSSHRSLRLALLAAALSFALHACRSAAPEPARSARENEKELADRAARFPSSQPAGDPTRAEVALPAGEGWRASLVVDQEPVGVWTVAALDVYPQYACPEIVGLDDAGRLTVFWSYSGKWTPVRAVHDGSWLGGLVQADVDPRVSRTQIYTGSRNGNLYQVSVHPPTFLDARLVAQLPGRQIHTLVGGELDPELPGSELLVFTEPGGLFLARARTDGLDGFEIEQLQELPGRIRDALLLSAVEARPAEIATAGRHGRIELLTLEGGKPAWSTIHEERTGAGRLALRPKGEGRSTVLYSVWDDGRVQRHERARNGSWSTELIYVGAQGTRGCAAGRFDADPEAETLAIFGYRGDVELLTRRGERWQVETVFADRDKGHWLAAGELDGRNATDELIAAGYSGRIVLISRPPGYGRPGLLAADDR